MSELTAFILGGILATILCIWWFSHMVDAAMGEVEKLEQDNLELIHGPCSLCEEVRKVWDR